MVRVRYVLLLFVLSLLTLSTHAQIGPPPNPGGGPPSGVASGCLTGTYPAPGLSAACINTAATGVVLADLFVGSDIGAKANSAASTLPLDQYNQRTGVVQINGNSTSVYYFSTTMSFNSLTTTLDCNGATLVYTGSTVAIVEAAPLRQNSSPLSGQALIAVGSANGGLRNCNLQTPQTYVNSGVTNTPAQPAFVPSITGLSITVAGTGYTTGDIVRVQQAGGALGTALVTASGGIPTGVTVLHGGYSYATGSGLVTVGGTGSGLTVGITSVNAPVSCYPYNPSPTLPTGIFIGGDPTGNITGDPSSNYGNYISMYNVHVSGFCGAQVTGNNAWQNQYYSVTFDHNYWGLDDELNGSIANSGERSTFHGGRIDGNSGANLRSDYGTEFTFDGTSFDYAESLNGSSQWVSGAPIIGSDLQIDLESVHIEDQYAPVIAETGTFHGNINVHDGDIRTNTLSVPADIALFQIAGTGGVFSLQGTLLNLQHVVTNWIYNPTNGATWRILNPQLGSEGAFPTTYSTSGNSYAGAQSSSEILNSSSIICWNNDTGMFRNAGSGVFAFGTSCNSPNGNGILQFSTLSMIGNVSKVAGIITAGSIGVPVVVASPTRLVGQTASLGPTSLQCNSAMCPAGHYRVHIYSEVTTTGSAGTLTASCGYTGAGAALTITPVNQNTGNATGIPLTAFTTPLAEICEIFSTGVANITYSTTVTGAVGSPQYDLSVYMERLQ